MSGILFQRRTGGDPPLGLVITPGLQLFRRGEGLVSEFFERHGGPPNVVAIVYVDDVEEMDAVHLLMGMPDGWEGTVSGPFGIDEGPEVWDRIFAFTQN